MDWFGLARELFWPLMAVLATWMVTMSLARIADALLELGIAGRAYGYARQRDCISERDIANALNRHATHERAVEMARVIASATASDAPSPVDQD